MLPVTPALQSMLHTTVGPGMLLARGLTSLNSGPCFMALHYATQAQRTFYAKDLEVAEAPSTSKPSLPDDLSFGKVFTSHMLRIEHSDSTGWQRPQVVPFGAISLHPASQVLHYGMCCFEGMKAYLGADGRGRLFRPDMNVARLARSAARLMLAGFDPKELQGCIEALLRVDRDWLPPKPGHSIYVRPFMFASDNSLGVHRSTCTTLLVILSPVGPYFKTGAQPVDLYMDTHNVRAWPGGSGAFKIGGNYSPTVMPQVEAATQHGCAQVMYTLPQGPDPDAALISECGAMNLFFVLRDGAQASSSSSGSGSGLRGVELVTPPLDGTILPGVTRDSILQLAQSMEGVRVSERPITVGELKEASAAGRLLEVFGAGTACVVQPVGGIVLAHGSRLEIRPGQEGDGQTLSSQLRQQLVDIQYGKAPHPWSVPFE